MPNTRNQFDNDGCLERGNTAEEKLNYLLNQRGFQTTKSTTDEDINEHWDYSFIKDNHILKVDVKGMKKKSRSDNEVQDKWHWLELHSVRQNDEGWLFNGHADWIAFETKESFVIVGRTDLINLVGKLVDRSIRVNSSTEAKYKSYQRKGRPDEITLIETTELRKIMIDEWGK